MYWMEEQRQQLLLCSIFVCLVSASSELGSFCVRRLFGMFNVSSSLTICGRVLPQSPASPLTCSLSIILSGVREAPQLLSDWLSCCCNELPGEAVSACV